MFLDPQTACMRLVSASQVRRLDIESHDRVQRPMARVAHTARFERGRDRLLICLR